MNHRGEKNLSGGSGENVQLSNNTPDPTHIGLYNWSVGAHI